MMCILGLAGFLLLGFMQRYPAQAHATVIPGCHTDEVKTTYGLGAGMGHNYFIVTFQNTGDKSCLLTGTPRVERIDNKGRPLPCVLEWPVSVNADGPGKLSMALAPKANAKLFIETLNRSGFSRTHKCASKLRLSFQQGTVRDPLIMSGDSCTPRLSASGFVPGN